MIRHARTNAAAVLLGLTGLASFLLVGCSSGFPQAGGKVPISPRPRVLIVGDSLTVGGFGDVMEWTFCKAFGTEKVAIYGSCGASVEHWLRPEPVFTCRCGYRETTPGHRIVDDYEGGRRPRPAATPKLEDLLRKYQPEVVVVQLGTNNFDTLQQGGPQVLAQQAEYFTRLADVMVRTTGTVRRAVWVAPPDSSKFSPAIQSAVESLILRAAQARGIYVIRSRKYTKYVPGTTGGDGVHYRTDAARDWARSVVIELNRILPPVQGGERPRAQTPAGSFGN